MLSRGSALLTFGLASIFAASAWATPVDLAMFADRIDAIGSARTAQEVGDGALLAALGAPGQREKALVAVRAASYAHAPEELMAPLVELACGRDPSLAPEAALSLHAVSERLTARELSLREVLLSDLSKAEERVKSGCEHTPSADVTYALEVAKERLAWLRSQASASP